MSSSTPASLPRGHVDAAYLVLRHGVWQYRRQVPKSLAHLEPRRNIRISTGARDKTTANAIAARLNAEVEEHWRLLATTPPDQIDAARERFQAATRLATRLAVTYNGSRARRGPDR